MNTKLSILVTGAVVLLAFSPFNARAGSAVATDGYGGAGYARGEYTIAELERKAIRQCREVSSHPENVHAYVSTLRKGTTVVVRFYVNGQPRIYAVAGYDSAEAAYLKCKRICAEYEGERYQVLQHWTD